MSGAMTVDAFESVCAEQPGAYRVVQWGGASVWKVGPRVFAIGAVLDPGKWGVSVKVTPIAFEALRDVEGYRPAPYLASRGLTWLQFECDIVDEETASSLIGTSYRLVAAGLPAKTRRDLSL